MREGKKQKIHWSDYRVDNFKFADEGDGPEYQCGAYALHTLTKIPLKDIIKLQSKTIPGHWPTRTMMRFLAKHGCSVMPITLGNMVWAHNYDNGKPEIGGSNVLLIDQHCYDDQGTWSVVYGGRRAHSGEVDPLNPLEFINYPILQAYLVFNPKWRSKR